VDPGAEELARLLARLTGLEETEWAEDTVAGLDQVAVLEPA
jgi:hypothetical protein